MAAELTYMVNVLLLDEEDNLDSLTLGWNSKFFKLRKGKSAFVPVEAAIGAFGDPRSHEKTIAIRDSDGGASGWIPDRASEVSRLRIFYGGEADRPDMEGINYPKVEVSNLEGERIYTVLDDPLGDRVISVSQTTQDKDELLAMLQRQQNEIDNMRRELGMLDEVTAESDLPRDDVTPPLFVGTGDGQ